MRAVLNVVLFLAAFCATATVASRLIPPPEVPQVSEKWRMLDARGSEFDVLFLGSSRTFRQLVPAVFDAEMANAGRPVRSFNLGVDGMRPPEDTFVLERALAGRTTPLKFVVVECNPVRLKVREGDRGTLRSSYWHDATRMAVLFRSAFMADPKKRSFRDRLGKHWEAFPSFWEHAEYFLEDATRGGRVNEMLALVPQPKEQKSGIGPDGFKPVDRRQVFKGNAREEYVKELETLRAKPPRLDFSDIESQAELLVKKRLIEKYGGKMVLVVPPFPSSKTFIPNEGVAPVIDFSDPNKWPVLYAPEHRSDEGHTNLAGSEEYTRRVVEGMGKL